jgi:hypothetical protein
VELARKERQENARLEIVPDSVGTVPWLTSLLVHTKSCSVLRRTKPLSPLRIAFSKAQHTISHRQVLALHFPFTLAQERCELAHECVGLGAFAREVMARLRGECRGDERGRVTIIGPSWCASQDLA